MLLYVFALFVKGIPHIVADCFDTGYQTCLTKHHVLLLPYFVVILDFIRGSFSGSANGAALRAYESIGGQT
jgi:hypothetical protein